MIGLVNSSHPNYNLAIEKMMVHYGENAVRLVDGYDLQVNNCEEVFFSCIFSWDVPPAVKQAAWLMESGIKVKIGGGGTYGMRGYIEKNLGMVPIYAPQPELDRVDGHFKMVYFTRGCIENCYFCIVPKIEGHIITLNTKSHPAPMLLDNNLSEIPVTYQEYIVERYLSAGLRAVDANSGFEPKGINEGMVKLWNKLPLKYWRIGFDELAEEKQVKEAIDTIRENSKKMIRVYAMIGHETSEECRYRLEKIIAWKCEPVPQAYIPINSEEKRPTVLHDWTAKMLQHTQRFYYQPALWRTIPFSQYRYA